MSLLLLLGPTTPSPPPVLSGTTLGTILAAARATLVAAGVANVRAIHAAMQRPYTFPYPGKSIVIFPGAIHPIKGVRDGAGRHAPAVEAEIITLVVDRHARDAAGADDFRLSDTTSGLYATDAKIIDTLKDEFILDSSSSPLTYEPVEWVATGTPRPYGRSFEWSGIETTYRAAFLQAVTINAGD